MTHESATSYLDENTRILRKNHPHLADAIRHASEPEHLGYELGRKGIPTLKVVDSQGEYYLHSAYDPLREANQFLDTELADAQKYDEIILLGFGLGYHVEALLERLNPTQKLIIIEPNLGTLRLALIHRPVAELLQNEQIIWIAGDAVNTAVAKTVPHFSSQAMHGWRLLIPPAMARYNIDYAKSYTRELSAFVNAMQVQIRTQLIASERFIANAFKNLKFSHRSPGVENFRQQWENKPLVLVGAGPSLDKQLPLLREYQHQVLIIAVGQAWRSLREADIVPHFLITIDPFDSNLISFYDIEPKGETLIADIYTNPYICEAFHGDFVFACSNPQFCELFTPYHGNKGVLETGGSVANNAFAFAELLGASPVVFIGMDLAYTDGMSHAEDNPHRHKVNFKNEKKQHSYRQVEGYDGKPVYTNMQMDSYRHWFENRISQRRDIEVINATEGGAAIKHTIQKSFRQTLIEHALSESQEQTIQTIKELSKQSVSTLGTTKSTLKQLKSALRKIDEISTDVLAVVKKIKTNPKGADAGHLAGKLTRLQAQYDKMPDFVRKLLEQIAIKENFAASQLLNQQDGIDAQLNYLGLIFQNTLNAVKKALPLVQQAQDGLQNDKPVQIEAHLRGNDIIGLAVKHMRAGEEDRAIELVELAYRYHPECQNGYARIGWIKAEKKEWEAAFELMHKDEVAQRLSPAWKVNLAQIYGRLDQYGHAKDLIRVAYDEDPELRNGFSRLGWIKVEGKAWQEALDLLSNDYHEKRQAPVWKINLAILYGRVGDFDSAKNIILAAYTEDSELKDGYSRLGWIMAEKKDWYGASEIASKDESLNRQNPAWSINLALLYGRQGDFDQAERLIEKAYAQNPDLKDGYSRLGWIKTDAKDWAGALAIVSKDENLGRQSSGWQINLAQLYGYQGDFGKAESLVDAAYSASYKLKDGYSRLGWIKTEAKDWAGALAIVSKDEDLGRQSSGWQINLAQLYGYQGDFDKAESLIEAAYSDNDKLKDGYSRLGWIKTEDRDWAAALAIMSKDEALGRQSPSWQINLAQLYGYQDNFSKAETLIEAAYDTNDMLKDGYSRLGWIKTEAKDWAGALAIVSKDEVLGRQTSAWRFNMAKLYESCGKLEYAQRLREGA